MNRKKVLVVGGGLAGSEAAYYLAQKGVKVVLIENKAIRKNPAQKLETFAELVCTNSLKSMNPNSGHGLLKTEMEKLGSLVLKRGKDFAVPAGDALAVDREAFSKGITETLTTHPNIDVINEEVESPIVAMKKYECDKVVVCTGPLTTDKLTEWLIKNVTDDDFYFYDAIAPVVDSDSLDLTKMYYKDRHKEIDDSADYLNAPMDKELYEKFIAELVAAEKVKPQNFEEYKFFEACLPVDLMAERGKDTPRFSCMKPIGLETKDGEIPYAVVQLRKENLLGSAYNLVGFQTRLTYPEQKRVFSMIPGFENASFIHLGSVHRNSFLNAKKLLNWDMSSKKYPELYFAGQMTGVEGYTESASSGLYVASNIYRQMEEKAFVNWPVETAIGALINYIMTCERPSPSNINFGLLPGLVLTKEQRKNRDRKKIKKQLISDRAQAAFDEFVKTESFTC